MDQPQPAIQRPGERRQPPRPNPPRESRPAPGPHPPRAGGPAPPGPDLIAGAVAIGRKLSEIRLFRTSSAIVRWIVLIVVVGLGAAFLTAFAIEVLVSLIPTS